MGISDFTGNITTNGSMTIVDSNNQVVTGELKTGQTAKVVFGIETEFIKKITPQMLSWYDGDFDDLLSSVNYIRSNGERIDWKEEYYKILE